MEPQNLHIQFEMRNNHYGKTMHQLQTIETERKLTCPWNHTLGCLENFDPNRKFSRIFINEVSVGNFIAVHANDNPNVLIVRVLSELKHETSDYYKVITRKTRECGHRVCTINCDHCHDSVVKVVNIRLSGLDEIAEYMNENYCFENFYCYYRDIEVISSVPKHLFATFPTMSIRRANLYLRTHYYQDIVAGQMPAINGNDENDEDSS